jgi:hypothetical protein
MVVVGWKYFASSGVRVGGNENCLRKYTGLPYELGVRVQMYDGTVIAVFLTFYLRTRQEI